MTNAAALSLVLPALAAALGAHRMVPAGSAAARVVTWFILVTSLTILPVQLAAALQLLGVIAGIPMVLPAVVSGLIAIGLLAAGREPRAGSRRTTKPRGMDTEASVRGIALAAAIIGCAYAIFSVDRLTSFPSSWDGVAYHLPLAVKWLQEGSLGIVADTDWRESLPANAEIIAMLVLATGWQALAEVWNVASAVALCAGSYLLAQGMGISPSGALMGAVVVASVPIVLFQAFSAYVDLFGSACLIGALGLFVASLPAGTLRVSAPRVLALSGLGCGLAVGTKPTLWPAAALVAMAVLAWLVWAEQAPRPTAALVLIFAGATAAPCLFWFVRNLAATGNPLYPLAVEVPGWVLLQGFRPSEITPPDYHLEFVRSRREWLVYPWIEFKRHGYNFSTGSGLGPVFAAFVPVGVLYMLWTLRDLPAGPARAIRLAYAGGLLASTAIWWWAVQGTPRFALPMVVLACVLATPFIDDAQRARPRTTRVLLVTAALGSAVLSALPPAQDVMSRVRHQLWERHRVYDVPELIDKLPPCSIVINHNPVHEFWNSFALAGKQLANTVVPPWEADRALQRPQHARCPTYVFDRQPFLSPVEAAQLEAVGYLPVEVPSDPRWRVWRRAAR